MAALKAVRVSDWLWCASLGIAWLPVLSTLWDARRISHPRALTAYVDLSFVLQPGPLLALTGMFLACIVCWTLRYKPIASALFAFLLLALLGNLENSLYEADSGVHHGKLLPAGALLAWAITWQLTRARPVAEREQHAHEAALGVAAGCYVLAALAKLQSGGLDWVSSTNIPLLMVERAIGAATWSSELRTFVGEASAGSRSVVLSVPALAIELFSVGLLWPRTRRAAALLLLALHLAIALLLGYVYVAWMLLLLGALVRPSAALPQGQPRAPLP